MANYENGLKITNLGLELQAKAHSGEPLVFTRIGLGSGSIPQGVDIKTLTDLIGWKMDAGMLKYSMPGDGTFRIAAAYNNQNLLEGFYWREVGLYAMDGAEEILYAVSNAGDQADFIPSGTAAIIIENEIELITIVGNATNVTASINDSLVYATRQDFIGFESSINSNVTSITNTLEESVATSISGVHEKVDHISRSGEITKREIQEMKIQLSEAEVIQFLNKTGIGYYHLFTDNSGIDMDNTTASITNADVIFSGLQNLKLLPQEFEVFRDIELAIYDIERNIVVPEASVHSVNMLEASIVPSSLAVGDSLYKDGEIYTITAIEVVA